MIRYQSIYLSIKEITKKWTGKVQNWGACVKKSVNKKAFYDKIKKIIGGVFYV